MTKALITLQLLALFLLSCANNTEKDDESGSEMGHRDMMGDDGMMKDGMMGDGMMSEDMRKAMMSEGMGPEMMDDMMTIHELLVQHEKINRTVEDLENGVKTRTTSQDPEVAASIRKHVRQMKERMEAGKPIRQMDPLFKELFEHADKIELQIEDIDDGVIVTETSKDPQVVKLIRQHARRAVNEFAAHGMKRAMQPTPLPEGYEE